MSTTLEDCPVCGAVGSLSGSYCQVCDSRSHGGGAADLPPAAPHPGSLRMTDVVEELRAISALVTGAAGGPEIAEAFRRTEDLLHALREQFLADVVLTPSTAKPPAPPQRSTTRLP